MYLRYFKRLFDIILSLMAIIVSLPIFVIIFIILAFSRKYPVFFVQERIGYHNKSFNIIKLNTMYKNADNGGTESITLADDKRIIPSRKFMRKIKIDEMPQLLNILLGTMSIVGARPQMAIDFEKYSPEVQAKIYNIRPGITGVGSIIFRDEEKWLSKAKGDKHEFYKNYISPYKGAVELWYQDHVSFITDMLIIGITACVLIRPNSNLIYKVFKDLPEKPEIFCKEK